MHAISHTAPNGEEFTDLVTDAAAFIAALRQNGHRKIDARLVRCVCGRPLHSPATAEHGVSRGCATKLRAAAVTLDTFTPDQLDKARELLLDGGLIPTARPTVFRSVASTGDRTYLTTVRACTCPSGIYRKTCYHLAAVRLLRAGITPHVPAGPPPTTPASITLAARCGTATAAAVDANPFAATWPLVAELVQLAGPVLTAPPTEVDLPAGLLANAATTLALHLHSRLGALTGAEDPTVLTDDSPAGQATRAIALAAAAHGIRLSDFTGSGTDLPAAITNAHATATGGHRHRRRHRRRASRAS